jgi:magnesium chelatase family protein
VKLYQQRISGPLLDRIDLHINVPRPREDERAALLHEEWPSGPSSTSVRQQVIACRERQLARAGHNNARLEQQQIRQHCVLAPHDRTLLHEAITRLRLSARASFRILKVARTIADLDESDDIATAHVLEAINYRRFDVL